MAKHRTPAPRAQRGETLAEVLVALLIVALATMLLAAMVMTAGSVNVDTRQKDEAFYDALGKVEALDNGAVYDTGTSFNAVITPDPATPTVSGTKKEVPVKVYSLEGLTFYKKNP